MWPEFDCLVEVCNSSIVLVLRTVRQAAAVIVLGILRICCNDPIRVGSRAIVIALHLVDNAAAGIGKEVVRV